LLKVAAEEEEVAETVIETVEGVVEVVAVIVAEHPCQSLKRKSKWCDKYKKHRTSQVVMASRA
jgi:hypothetical protein